MSDRKQMHLGAFMTTYLGHHLAAWRYPATKTEQVTHLALYREIAELTEKGKFDILFLADVLAINPEGIGATPEIRMDATTMMATLTALTSKVGLVSTVSTTYNHPFNVARKFSTIDHLSGGRAAWNVVTSAHQNEAENFGLDRHMEHGDRYAQSEEFVHITNALWDSWDDDALLFDRAGGRFLDDTKVRPVNHEGRYYRVKGPLNIPRSPQGRPVLFAAGASEAGKAFAARNVDAFFTIAPPTVQAGQALYREMKQRVASHGRDPAAFKIMPGVVPFVAATRAEAEDKFAHFQELVLPELGIGQLCRYLNHDLTQYSPDDLLPDLPGVEAVNGEKGRYQLLAEMSRTEKLTIKELGRYFARGQGHLFVVGSGSEVADTLSEWFLDGACDGFNVKFPYFPGGIADFVDHVTPELQQRGLFRTDYIGSTLREHLGLPVPTPAAA